MPLALVWSFSNRSHVFARRTDGKIVETIAVEISRGEGVAEEISRLGGPGNACRLLTPHLVAVGVESSLGSVDDVNGTRVG